MRIANVYHFLFFENFSYFSALLNFPRFFSAFLNFPDFFTYIFRNFSKNFFQNFYGLFLKLFPEFLRIFFFLLFLSNFQFCPTFLHFIQCFEYRSCRFFHFFINFSKNFFQNFYGMFPELTFSRNFSRFFLSNSVQLFDLVDFFHFFY